MIKNGVTCSNDFNLTVNRPVYLFYCACLRANHHGLTLDQISTMIIGNMDKNADGDITVDEIDTEFVTKYDHDGERR